MLSGIPIFARCLALVWFCAAATLAFAGSFDDTPEQSPGIAWSVKGQWQDAESGRAITPGDKVPPGALLRPRNPDASNSITVLLPDGQRVLNECFTPADCGRGFRVPSLIEHPSPFQVRMLARISEILLDKSGVSFGLSTIQTYATPVRLDEVAVTLAPRNSSGSLSAAYRVSIAGVVSALPDGSYSYDLRRLGQSGPVALHVPWKKRSARLALTIPGRGLYEVTIRDSLEVPRIDVMIAAVRPKQRHIRQDLLRARKVLESWDDESYGWPVHPLLRAYLRSLFGS